MASPPEPSAPRGSTSREADAPALDAPHDAVDGPLLDGAWRGLEAELARERGPMGRLRGLPTGARIALAMAAGVALPSLVVLLAPRDDLAGLGLGRVLVWAAALLPILTLGALVSTRGLTSRALESSRVLALASAALVSLVVLALVPLGAALDPVGHGPIPCGSMAVVVGAVTFALVHGLRRDAIGSRVGAAAVASCAAFAAAAFMCPIDVLAHVSIGHALPAALLVLVGVAWDRRQTSIAA